MTSARFPMAVWLAVATATLVATEALCDSPVEMPPERPITAEERDHWSYRPLARVSLPEVPPGRFAAHPIDRFVIAGLHAIDVEPLPRAGKLTLLRRVSIDLSGLPPSEHESRAFLADDSPDAYARVVDRLLASPAYGERWAQHWLDLARFAETDGFEHDLVRPNAWRYRDWVIEALNADMPYDEFVRLQLAGDILQPGDPRSAVATGFLLCGPDMPDLNLQDERRHVVLNEMTGTVGAVFLAMQFGCAACHDHKFDPIRQHDFYRLRAFFEPAEMFRDHPVPSDEQRAERGAAEAAVDPVFKELEARRRELEALGRDRAREKNPDEPPTIKASLAELDETERKEHRQVAERLKSAPQQPEFPLGRVVQEGRPKLGHFFARGDFRQVGPELASDFPRVLAGQQNAANTDEPPRARLARWLTRTDNALFARVIANRLWQWHFGAGLAANANDFGVMGSAPSHLELLDWLARRLSGDGWSLKRMHRLLVTSETYQLAAAPFDHAWTPDEVAQARATWTRSHEHDPDNALSWHRRHARLDAETIRDAMLAAAERLSPRRGGPGIRPPLAAEVTTTLLKDQWVQSGDDEDHRRRSIYVFVRRNLRFPLFDVFDRPDTNASCAVRHESTTAPQSLALLNSEFSLRAARMLAGALEQAHPGAPREQLEAAYWRVYCRPPRAEELVAGLEFVAAQAARLRSENRPGEQWALPEGVEAGDDPAAGAALVDFCLALFNANEFVYLD